MILGLACLAAFALFDRFLAAILPPFLEIFAHVEHLSHGVDEVRGNGRNDRADRPGEVLSVVVFHKSIRQRTHHNPASAPVKISADVSPPLVILIGKPDVMRRWRQRPLGDDVPERRLIVADMNRAFSADREGVCVLVDHNS